MRPFPGAFWLLTVLLAGPAPQARAQDEPAAREGDTLGWHVVQPGESWVSITERYLGTSSLWPENWRLNPHIEDQHLLRPGQRVRVIIHREPRPRSAELTKVERRVERKPDPQSWTSAHTGDELREGDGLRTYRRASAQLSFDDDSQLTITEQSLVFLRELDATLTGVRRESIEVVEGQADVEVRPARANSTEIEILVAGATARPRLGRVGRAQTRARRSEQGAAQLMVYEGASDVAAGGVQLTVPKGMGTAVAPGGTPSPPEKLLAAPAPVVPARRSSWSFANPRFSWRAVSGAVAYQLEVCRDAQCGQLIQRATGLSETRWQPAEGLPVGPLFFRVTAVAGSGLDGYPSRGIPFSIESDLVDRTPPVVIAVVSGLRAPAGDEPVLLRPDVALRLRAHDDAAGVERVRYRWNGGAWTDWNNEDLRAPNDGSNALEFQASDMLGRESPTWLVEVIRDGAPPPLPAVRDGGIR